MLKLAGKSVYKGIAMGPIVVLKKTDSQVKRSRVDDAGAELKRLEEAIAVSQEQLGKLYEKALKEVGEASAAIFEVHQMMLEDLVSHIAHAGLVHAHAGQDLGIFMYFLTKAGDDLFSLVHGHAANNLVSLACSFYGIIHVSEDTVFA